MVGICGPLLILLGTSLIVDTVHGAVRVDANKRAKDVMRRRREEAMKRRRDLQDIWPKQFSRALEEEEVSVDELLDLTKGEAMHLAKEGTTSIGPKIEKLQETYLGVEVYDAIVTVKKDKNGKLTGDASGHFVQGIADDLKSVEPRLSDDETLEIVIKEEGDEGSRDVIGDVHINRIVYLDKGDKARLVNKVQYLIEADDVKRPTYIIDANSGAILMKWNELVTFNCGPKKTYKGYGGNEKMGKIKYGDAPNCLEMRIDGDMCYLENKYAEVVDMQNSRNESLHDIASFKCKNGYEDEVNGAYSPALDAFFYATVVGKMYEEWYQTTALPHKIIIRVHYGYGYENAFWNGQNCTFGDGQSMFYPFSNSLDVVSHEVGHGVTEHGSGLMYSDEAGGMNEAFSDIIGEAAQEYLTGHADLETGAEIMKRLPNLRDFAVPESDNSSIGHADDMHPSMDPHLSSGVYRRVFYVVVKQKGISVRNAAHVFLHANRMYWHHSGTFYDCACGLLKAAVDLGFSTTAFERAVQDVGVSPCDYVDHIFSLANNITQPNVTVSSEVRPVFRFEAVEWAEDVIVNVTSASGSVHVTVQNGTWAEDEFGNPIDVIAEGDNHLVVSNVPSSNLFLQFSTDSVTPYTDVNVVVGYTCDMNYSGSKYGEYRWYCGLD